MEEKKKNFHVKILAGIVVVLLVVIAVLVGMNISRSRQTVILANPQTDSAVQEKSQVPKAEPAQEAAASGSEAGGDIGADAAAAAAMNHAGVTEVRDFECELDYEYGKAVYEISFKVNGYEYDYEIDASNGAVLKSEKEID